jgi:endonuclease/exonuclease/phosphatase family metal-dependent hydrolase
MTFRIATLNLEQDHKRWPERRSLILEQLDQIRPDILALNEVCLPHQTGRWLQETARDRLGLPYRLVQQSKTNHLGTLEGEAILTRHPILETANFDYQAQGMVAQVTRLEVEDQLLDVYVTHLYRSLGEDALRLYQVQQLLAWTGSRQDGVAAVVCGDFNATLEMPSAQLMAQTFRPSQLEPTAFTPLQGEDGAVSHPYWPRLDRCIDYIWVSEGLEVTASEVGFNIPSPTDPTLWPSDHAGVWADLIFASSPRGA